MKYLLPAFIFLSGIILFSSSCKDDKTPDNEAMLKFVFKLDSTQARLDNIGQPATMPSGNAGQVPQFNGIAGHYVELAPTAYTQVGDGAVLFKNEETTAGGSQAIKFDSEIIVNEGEVFLEVPLSSVPAGSYSYIRISLAYQNYDVVFWANVPPLGNQKYTGTLSSFVGYNTYISSYKVKDSTVTVNGNRLQGYWGFETAYNLTTGQAQATTVPNPLAATSPIPAGSCLVTGAFDTPLVISGDETQDITVTASLSINDSFEWEDLDNDDQWDPLDGENVVDMGLRGLEASYTTTP